jgi:hypothetical protein
MDCHALWAYLKSAYLSGLCTVDEEGYLLTYSRLLDFQSKYNSTETLHIS